MDTEMQNEKEMVTGTKQGVKRERMSNRLKQSLTGRVSRRFSESYM